MGRRMGVLGRDAWEHGGMKGVLERHVGGDGHKNMGGEESEAG